MRLRRFSQRLCLKSFVREADGMKVAQRFSAGIAAQFKVLVREAGDRQFSRSSAARFAGSGFRSYDYPALKGWATIFVGFAAFEGSV